MTIGERILDLIRQRGMTQKAFSEMTGIPQSTMSSWKGKKQNPSMDKLQVICDALKVDPYYLLSGTKVNESVNLDYVVVYRDNHDEYELIIQFQKMNEDSRKRLIGYAKALLELEEGNNSL